MNTQYETIAEWQEKARELFGKDPMKWRFVCPVCGHSQSVQDYKDAGAPSDVAAFSCVGRWREGAKEAFSGGDNSKGCTYAGGGLIRMNPIKVADIQVFAFDESGISKDSEQ